MAIAIRHKYDPTRFHDSLALTRSVPPMPEKKPCDNFPSSKSRGGYS